MTTMRAKMRVTAVDSQYEGQENLTFTAVCKDGFYPEDGTDENNSFARWTPSADLTMMIQNPDLFGKFEVNDEYYLDFTKAE